jgi:hypothetical protein
MEPPTSCTRCKARLPAPGGGTLCAWCADAAMPPPTSDVLPSEGEPNWEVLARVRYNMLKYIAFATTGDEKGDPQLGVDRLKADRDTWRDIAKTHAIDAKGFADRLATLEAAVDTFLNAVDRRR